MKQNKTVRHLKLIHSRSQPERHSSEQRQSRRLDLKHFWAAGCLMDDQQLFHLDLVNVSETGCAIKIPSEGQLLWLQKPEELAVRLYLNKDSYLPLKLQIKNSRPLIEDGIRYLVLGCALELSCPVYEAYQKFISFLEAYSELAFFDLDDLNISYL